MSFMFNLRFIKQTDFKDTFILYYTIFCFHYLFQNVVMYNFLRINITATSECNSLGFDSKHLRLMDVRLLNLLLSHTGKRSPLITIL